VKFNPDAELDTSGVEDVRGSGGGGRGLGLPVGGGIGGLIVLVIILLLTGGELPGGGTGNAPDVRNTAAGSLNQCTKGSITQNPECRFVFYQNSLENYWSKEVPRRGGRYARATMVVFEGQVNTACGAASSAVGPFYCPADNRVYLDIGFFQVLESQLGAKGGDFAEAYVLAHEYGHHIQNLYGILGKIRSRQGPTSDAVRSELQADCLAGVWAYHAQRIPARNGVPLITDITDEDIAEGIDAAETVGDDRIQEKTQGQANPETFSHGTSEQRRRWFTTGMQSGDMQKCDTWNTNEL
jgi:uncharacterized protein